MLDNAGCRVEGSQWVATTICPLHKMASQLAWIERQDITARNARAYAMRSEAATLRQEIREAQVLIDRLRGRYLINNERT